MINSHNCWIPGTCESLSYSDICDYFNIYINDLKLKLSYEHNFNEFRDECILTRQNIVDRTEKIIKDIKSGDFGRVKVPRS